MKKIIALMLALTACTGVPQNETTTAPAQTTETPVETTEAPVETTEPAVLNWKTNQLRSDDIVYTSEYEFDFAQEASNYTVFGSEYKRSDIRSVNVVTSLAEAPAEAWDVSIGGDKSVMAWVVPVGPRYDLYIGADGGIGGTYGAMPELYVELYRCVKAGELDKALEIQNDCCRIIYKLCSGHGNMYGMIKESLRRMGCPDCGSVRAPLAELIESDYAIVDECVAMIQTALAKYC